MKPAVRSAPPAPTCVPNRKTSFLTLFLLLLATVSWRRGIYYDGGIDPVVAGKAVVSLIALTLAWRATQTGEDLRPVRGLPVALLVAYAAVSIMGAYAADQLLASGVLAVRLLIVALTLYLLARRFPGEVLFRDLVRSMLLVATISAVTGVALNGLSDRLFGGVPPLHANELAMLFAMGAMGIAWLALNDGVKGHHGLVFLFAVGAIWLTGSRTSLAALLIALILMIMHARRPSRLVATAVVASIPLGYYSLFASEVLDGFFLRGGGEQWTTLSSRTIAWSAAWTFPDTFWARWTGVGLAQKLIPVRAQWWDVQLLDSTWVSALVQVGLLGIGVLLVLLATVTTACLRTPRPIRMFLLAALGFLLIRSLLESGLFDSTPSFLVLMLIALVSHTNAAGHTEGKDASTWPGRYRAVR